MRSSAPSKMPDQNVGKSCTSPLLQLLPTFLPGSPGYLTSTTLASLRRYFADKGHRPSEDMWSALSDLAATMDDMVTGHAGKKLFLASLDPGVGKTQTLTHFVNALLSTPVYQDVGVIICIGRLTEIKNLINDMGLPANMLAVLTSDAELNALGQAAVDDAQVLITTQQRIEKTLSHGEAFTEASPFFFHGKPRQVRVWDESYLPGATLTLNRDDALQLLKPLRGSFPRLTEAVDGYFARLNDIADGTIVELPDFASDHRVELNDVLRIFDNPRDVADGKYKDAQLSVVNSLFFLSGKIVTVRRDGKYGNTVLDFRDTLPEDLAPMIIMDASGRVRETYHDMEVSRGSLVKLKTATKKYDNLTVNVWSTGGGKSAFQRNGDQLCEGIAKTINTKPDEHWLVVYHKEDARVGDVVGRVRKLLTGPQENVSFLPWGQHMATNDYVNVSNVILAGTLYYRQSHYESLKRLGAGRSSRHGAVTRDEVKRVEAGEHAHLILQALCRCAVRRCDGEHCHPCTAYIIASVHSEITTALPGIFPGCRVDRWQPVTRKLTGHVAAAVEIINEWSKTATQGDVLKFSSVAKRLGVSRQDFKKNVRGHSDFVDTIAELGVKEYGASRYYTAFIRAADLYGFEAVEDAVAPFCVEQAQA